MYYVPTYYKISIQKLFTQFFGTTTEVSTSKSIIVIVTILNRYFPLNLNVASQLIIFPADKVA